ncbi:MAG: hypothetical protein KME55_04645 [Nostoc indistinguendum CM1-VF10]|nr:hypothetical protein [Nostoc indistinguendum CM1-VF10]
MAINLELVTEITSVLETITPHLNGTLPNLLTVHRVKILNGNAIASKNLCNK